MIVVILSADDGAKHAHVRDAPDPLLSLYPHHERLLLEYISVTTHPSGSHVGRHEVLSAVKLLSSLLK